MQRKPEGPPAFPPRHLHLIKTPEGDDADVTRTVLREVKEQIKKDSHEPNSKSLSTSIHAIPAGSQGGGHDEPGEHEEHIDERWLVSYADMMTLLFGLFVMLYSMSSKFNQVQQSIAEKFTKPEKTQQAPKVEIDPEELKRLQEEVARLRTEVARLQAETTALRTENTALKADVEEKQKKIVALIAENTRLEVDLKKALEEIERLKALLASATLQAKQIPVAKAEPKVSQAEFNELKKNLELKAQEVKRLQASVEETKTDQRDEKRELKRAQAEVRQLKESLASATEVKSKALPQINPADLEEIRKKLQVKTKEVKALQADVENLRKQLDEKTQAVVDLQKVVNEQKLEIEKLKKLASNSSFVAVVIKWSTTDHDIDLVIEDPEGKRFDFKHRKFADHPGNLALDTRRGPGTELWQSDRIIPGTYKATYIFYNQYGNKSPAPVSGTVFTGKGSEDLPPANLDFGSKSRITYSFSLDATGSIKVLK